MKYRKGILLLVAFIFLVGGMLALPAVSHAAPPVVKTVPFVPGDPTVPHTTWSGKQITLKGTSDVAGVAIQYEWDFGDGSPPATGTVTNEYVIEASHAYTGSSGDIFAARLTVTDLGTSESGSALYFVIIQDQTLEVEVNVAIDEGLWYLHKTMRRYDVRGDWNSGVTGSGYYSNWAANINAFEVNGHLESGNSSNPYTETVARGMKRLFESLTTEPIFNTTYPPPTGTVNPDSNGNGYGVRVNQSYYPYQGGMLMDAIVNSGTPTAVTTTGQAPSGANPGILGRTYEAIVQDMVDSYAFGQYNANSVARGGWRYSWNDAPDNSACQWAAIGIIPAERNWGVTVPSWVKTENEVWLTYSQSSTGWFGYTGLNQAWGYYATSPSGMVQLAMDGIGRGDSRWDNGETWIRDRFCNTGGAYYAIRDYYYGLFSFTKSMLLHDSNGDGVAEPLNLLQSQTPGVTPLDWYEAEVSQGDPCDGVARTLVNDQNPAGYWYNHNYSSAQYTFETGWAIVMLRRTPPGDLPPTAIAQAIPNPGLADQPVRLDGSASRANAPSASVVLWEWDVGCDDSFEFSGPVVEVVSGFTADTDVCLRVTDDQDTPLSDDTEFTVFIVPPPVPPTADADGPYVFCPQAQPWFLDGTGSVNPDEGLSEIGQPGNTIIEYAWDLDIDGQFDDAFGPQPDVTAYFTAQGVGVYPIQLRVTDNSSVSHPVTSGGMDLSDNSLPTAVVVLDAADPACAGCIDNLAARPKSGKVQLTWAHTGAVSYNVYRGTIEGGPYAKIANTTSTYSTYLDTGVTNGTTYYYVVRPAALNGDELCQSNEASATPTARIR